MRLFRSNIVLCCALTMTFIAGLSIGCTSKSKDNNSHVRQQEKELNKEKGDWTDTVIDSWYIRLHNPGPAGQHPVWEGPVQIGRSFGNFDCNAEIELIDGMWVGHQENVLIFSGYSGSKTYNYIVNLDSCTTTTKEMPTAGIE